MMKSLTLGSIFVALLNKLLMSKNEKTRLDKESKNWKLMTNRNRLVQLMLLVSLIPLLSQCAGQRTILQEKKKVSGSLVSGNSPVGDPRCGQSHVWFIKSADDKFEIVPVKRNLRLSGSAEAGQTPIMQMLESAVSELVKGPEAEEEAQGLGSEIPKGTVLISVTKAKGEGIALNLSKRFLAGSGADSFEMRMNQLKRTVEEVAPAAGKAKVFLNVEGERVSQATGDGIDVAQPINQ